MIKQVCLELLKGDPELNQFSPRELDRLATRAKSQRGDAIWIIPTLAALPVGLIWTGATFGAIHAYTTATKNTTIDPVMWTLALGVGPGFLLFLVVLAVIRRAMLRRTMRRIADPAGCPYCSFSLEGLDVIDNWVTCPECGNNVSLIVHGIPLHAIKRYGATPDPQGAGNLGAYTGELPKRAKGQAPRIKHTNTGPRSNNPNDPDSFSDPFLGI